MNSEANEQKGVIYTKPLEEKVRHKETTSSKMRDREKGKPGALPHKTRERPLKRPSVI